MQSGLGLLLMAKATALAISLAAMLGHMGEMTGMVSWVAIGLELVALKVLARRHAAYEGAFRVMVAAIVCAVARALLLVGLSATAIGQVVSECVMMTVGYWLSYQEIRHICRGTSGLLQEAGEEKMAAWGDRFARMYLVYTGVLVIYSVAALLWVFYQGTGGGWTVNPVAAVMQVLFLVFLFQAHGVLG